MPEETVNFNAQGNYSTGELEKMDAEKGHKPAAAATTGVKSATSSGKKKAPFSLQGSKTRKNQSVPISKPKKTEEEKMASKPEETQTPAETNDLDLNAIGEETVNVEAPVAEDLHVDEPTQEIPVAEDSSVDESKQIGAEPEAETKGEEETKPDAEQNSEGDTSSPASDPSALKRMTFGDTSAPEVTAGSEQPAAPEIKVTLRSGNFNSVDSSSFNIPSLEDLIRKALSAWDKNPTAILETKECPGLRFYTRTIRGEGYYVAFGIGDDIAGVGVKYSGKSWVITGNAKVTVEGALAYIGKNPVAIYPYVSAAAIGI